MNPQKIDTLLITFPNIGANCRNIVTYLDEIRVSTDIEPTTEFDISDTLQGVIDIAAAAGGGIVYLPSGDYNLQKPIIVKSGVELRGSADRPHFGTAINTTFVTDYGINDENGTALITLESNSGMRGLTIDYSETRPDGTPYAYTIRGNGENIYMINCTVDSAWQVADFMTNRCDNHYIEAISFGTLKTGIAVGGGSVNGVVRDCQSNPSSNRDSRNTVRSDWFAEDGTCLSAKWTLENVTGYIVDNSINELHFMNFIYGASTGISVTGNSTLSTDKCKYNSDIDGGYLYCTLDNDTNPTISFYRSNSINASDMRYIEFDFYVSDTEFLNNCKEMQFEVSSSTYDNVNEISFALGCFKDGMLKSGWNHIKLDLKRYDASNGSFDANKVKRIRMYYVLDTALSGEIRIKNVDFSTSNYPPNYISFSGFKP